MRKINLAPFCMPKGDQALDRYPTLSKPFRVGAWLYATDGRIAVRVPALNESQSAEKVPKIKEFFGDFAAASCVEPWPSARDTSLADGVLTIPRQTVGGRLIGGEYWFCVAMLGRVRFNPGGGPDDPIEFIAGPLQGILCPREK